MGTAVDVITAGDGLNVGSEGRRSHPVPGAMAHLGECGRDAAPSTMYQPPLHQSQPSPLCTQVPPQPVLKSFPSCRLAQPLGIFLTQLQFYISEKSLHLSNTPTALISAAPRGWISLALLSPHPTVWAAPGSSYGPGIPNSSEDRLWGTSPFQAASLW